MSTDQRRTVRLATVRRKLGTFVQVRLINPVQLREAGELGSGAAILETTGRKSGLPRQLPVFDCLQGDVFWIVAHHGRSAAYVRNLEVDPRVRVKVRGRWRTGRATLIPNDDPIARVGSINPRAAATAKRMGTELLTIRVDLEP